MFNSLFILFLISIIFGGSLYIGPASPRQYMTVLMTTYFIFQIKYVKRYWNKYLTLYLLFILFYGVSSFMENGLETFVREFISRYIVCIVAYLATRRFLETKKSYKEIIYTILCCGIINSVITILQYFKNPIGSAVGSLFVDLSNEAEYWKFQHMVDGDAGATFFGMMTNGVFNGYFTMIMPILILYFLYEEKRSSNIVKQFTCWGGWLFFILCSFIIQERAPFLIALVMSAYILLRESKYKMALLTTVVVSSFVLIPLIEGISIWTNSRFAGGYILESDLRVEIFSQAFYFIVTHPLFGGIRSAVSAIGNMPHNFIFNAFIYGGIIGGAIVLYIIFSQARTSFVLIKKEFAIVMPMSFLAYTLNGLTHNPSIITGEVIMWIMWACVYYDYLFYRKVKQIKR